MVRGAVTHFDLEEVFWRPVDLVECLLAGFWYGLHGSGGVCTGQWVRDSGESLEVRCTEYKERDVKPSCVEIGIVGVSMRDSEGRGEDWVLLSSRARDVPRHVTWLS